MNNKNTERYVITGGPGVGKTALVNALKQRGFVTIQEDARKIIKQQMAIGGNGLPWEDKVLYARLMFDASLKSFRKISLGNYNAPIFFDRGILDAVCYMHMEDIPLFNEILIALNDVHYNRNVFILPPWRAIYHVDDERKQSWAEALHTFDKIKETYQRYGYNLVEVPKVRVSERVRFVIDRIKHPY